MRSRAFVDVVRGLASVALFVSGCGGDSPAGTAPGGAGSGAQAGSSSYAAGTGSSSDPGTCTESKACSAGYVCVPPAGTMVMTVTDPQCLTSCNSSCELAGPVKDMCLQNCMLVCKHDEPAAGVSFTGKCERAQSSSGDLPNGGGAGSSSPSGGGAAGSSTTYQNSFVWSGSWTADITHTSNCTWSSASQTGKQTYTVTINATGENSAPKASISGGFMLEGTGGDDHISLTGDFPFRSWKGEVATTNSLNSPNNATIKITTIESSKKISGTIEGSWDASAGWTCKTASGTITLTR